MKRAGLTAATIVFGMIAVGGILMRQVYWPKMQRQNSAVLAATIEEALMQYYKDYQDYPTGESVEVIKCLLGQNPHQKTYLREDFRKLLDPSGLPLDGWKRALRFERGDNGAIKVKSAGPNGQHGDVDDITSKDIQTAS